MRVSQGADNGGIGTMERRAAEAANVGLILAHYRPTTSGALAIGSTTTKVTLGANVTYSVNGSIVTKNSAADVWSLGTATSGTTVAAGSIQRYILTLDASGAAFTYEGVQQLGTDPTTLRYTNINGKGSYVPLLYVAGLGQTLIGSVQVLTDGTHTFIPGTTALNATGITAAYTSGLDSTFVPLIGDLTGRSIGSF